MVWPGTAAGVGGLDDREPGDDHVGGGVQRGSVLPAGQLLPGAVVASVTAMTWVPEGYGLAMMIAPMIVTVAPTGTSPVQTAPVAPTDRVPELAVSLPASLIWAAVAEVVKLTLIP